MTQWSISRAEWLLTVHRLASSLHRIKSIHFKDIIGWILTIIYRCVTIISRSRYTIVLSLKQCLLLHPPSPIPSGPGPRQSATCFLSLVINFARILLKRKRAVYDHLHNASEIPPRVCVLIFCSFFIAGQNSNVRTSCNLLLRSQVDEHLQAVHVLVITRSASRNICVRDVLWTCFRSSWAFASG